MFQIIIMKKDGEEDELKLIDPDGKYIAKGNEDEIRDILKDHVNEQVLIKMFRDNELITYFVGNLIQSEDSIKIKLINDDKKRR